MADHGTRQSYADGCRCQDCKVAQATYMREYKARQAGVDIPVAPPGRPRKDATVTQLPGVPAVPPTSNGATLQAVLDELATLTSAETRRGAAESAKALARILDNPNAINSHVAAAKALPVLLEDLRKGSARRKGRLASVQSMVSKPGSDSATG